MSRGEYGGENGRRRDCRAGEAIGASSCFGRCGHRTRRDPRRGRRLCVGHGVDSRPRRSARGNRCCGGKAWATRIARHRRGTTQAAASLCAAGWNSDLSQLGERTPGLLTSAIAAASVESTATRPSARVRVTRAKVASTNLDSRSGNPAEVSAGGEGVGEGAVAPPGDLDSFVLVSGFEEGGGVGAAAQPYFDVAGGEAQFADPVD